MPGSEMGGPYEVGAAVKMWHPVCSRMCCGEVGEVMPNSYFRVHFEGRCELYGSSFSAIAMPHDELYPGDYKGRKRPKRQ